MKVVTYEAIVENGQIKVSEGVRLPEHARVYIVIPCMEEASSRLHVGSPRLSRPEQAADFTMEVAEEPRDAGLR